MLCFGYPTQQQEQRQKPSRFAVEDMVCQNGYKEKDMAGMLARQTGRNEEELADWVRRFCQRKWNSDFSREMSRSCAEMIRHWCSEKE